MQFSSLMAKKCILQMDQRHKGLVQLSSPTDLEGKTMGFSEMPGRVH